VKSACKKEDPLFGVIGIWLPMIGFKLIGAY
jgi:hypothetical protein